MITAYTLRQCAWLGSRELEVLLQKNYPEDQVLESNFLGVSNGGQFCYQIGYQDPDLAGQGLTHCKVYVWQENNGDVRADY